jgi:hypothetical protein
MIKTRIFEDSNYKSIYFNGKTIRFQIDPHKEISELEYPEFYDIKLTNKCKGGCEYCYQDSKKEDDDYKAVERLHKFFSSMTENQKPYQIACLESNTLVSTPDGMIKIKDLKINEYVYNEFGKPIKIINKIKSNKKTIKLKGSKGFNIICTKDHVFLDENNKEVQAENLLNKKLKIAEFEANKEIPQIDMIKYGNKSSRTNKRGGSSGMVLNEDKTKIALMHTMKLANRFISLNEDIMWLYGLTVAEGYKRGLCLSIHEKDYIKKAIKTYKDITGLNLKSNIRKNPDGDGCNIEMFQPKYWESLFLKEMEIGYGSKNVSLKYLYKLPVNLVKSAIKGLFDGDGCYRERYNNKKYYYTASYKTASKRLAYELVDILHKFFNIKASLYSGFNKVRKIGDRMLPKTEYYQVEIYGEKNLNILFNEEFSKLYKNFGKKLYSNNKNYIKILSIEEIGNKEVFDITLENDSSHLFTISHNIVTHNCGGGEPTLHPDFTEIMKLTREHGISPNYTTNGMFVDESNCKEILDSTKKYCEGVAVTCHKHLEKYWKKAIQLFLDSNIFTNTHHLISDRNSIQDFLEIYHEYQGKIKYFVLLPVIEEGRAKNVKQEYNYLFDKLQEFDNIKDIAFGANFYPYLKDKRFEVALYEPEIMSKYLDLKDMSLYKSSFNTKKPIKHLKEFL